MRPASQSGLSFHSSSEGDSRNPIVGYEDTSDVVPSFPTASGTARSLRTVESAPSLPNLPYPPGRAAQRRPSEAREPLAGTATVGSPANNRRRSFPRPVADPPLSRKGSVPVFTSVEMSPEVRPPPPPLQATEEGHYQRVTSPIGVDRRLSKDSEFQPASGSDAPPRHPPRRRRTLSPSHQQEVPRRSSSGLRSSHHGVPIADQSSAGWWGLVRRLVADSSSRMGEYLDSVIDPLGAPLTPASPTYRSNKNRNTSKTWSGSSGLGVFQSIRSHHSPYGGSNRNHEEVTQRVTVDPAATSHVPYAPMLEEVDDELLMDEYDDGEASNVDDAAPMFEVDLISAIVCYRQNPNEVFAHLVAAALSTRSEEFPVIAEEVYHARGSPYLMRLIVDSGALDVEDPAIQQYYQEQVDQLVRVDEPDINPALYEYLSSFFTLHFIRLEYDQYALLKRSGFEYLRLMKEESHVLPIGYFHCLFNTGIFSPITALIFMLLNLGSVIFHTVCTGLVLSHWMNSPEDGDSFALHSRQSYGFYTLIVFGCGYALYLICVAFAVRNRPDETPYESRYHRLPSPYINVVPVLPLFDTLTIVGYVDAYRHRLLIACHNILNMSYLSGVFFSFCFGWPQYITQSYFNHTLLSIPTSVQMDWSFKLLRAAALLQWAVSMLRFTSAGVTSSSVNISGFADFNIRYTNTVVGGARRGTNLLNMCSLFVFESNVYLLVASSIMTSNFDSCDYLPSTVIGITGMTILLLCGTYLVLIFTSIATEYLCGVHVVVVALQTALFVVSETTRYDTCSVYRGLVFRDGYIFGYVSWGMYAVVFVYWLVLMIKSLIARCNGPNLAYQSSYPCLRSRAERVKARELERQTSKAADRSGRNVTRRDPEAESSVKNSSYISSISS